MQHPCFGTMHAADHAAAIAERAGRLDPGFKHVVGIGGDHDSGPYHQPPPASPVGKPTAGQHWQETKRFGDVSNKPIARFLDPDRSGSLTHRCRQQRNEEFKRRFPQLAEMRVLDLGGTAVSWRVAGLRAKSVTIVNLDRSDDPEESWMETVQGDACVGDFGKYDLVFSNSVLEHVGGHGRRQQFADVVQNSAPLWWVQTPYRYFPIEPHWLFPGFQFLPFRARVLVTQHWNVGHNPVLKDEREAAALVASTELVSATEMRTYFPGGEIWFERIAALPKSIVAFKNV